MLTFQSIELESHHGDENAVLVLRSGRLVAIATRLGKQHGPKAGEWYVEAVFTAELRIAGQSCASLDQLTMLIEAG